MQGIPNLSHLQAVVLNILLDEENKSGEEIRQELESVEPKEGPAFYQLMQRMEKSGYVEGEYKMFSFRGRKARRERFYRLTSKGIEALQHSTKFYSKIRV